MSSRSNMSMSLTLLTAAISLYLVSRIPHVKAAGQCGTQTSNYGSALKRHTFETFKVNRPDVCITRCQNEPRCQSLNYVMEEGICELNSKSKETRPHYYVTDPRRIYMTVHFNKGMRSYRDSEINSPY